MRVVILGHTGMLGSMVFKVLSKDKDLEVCPIGRRELNARFVDDWGLRRIVQGADWVINCIGLIPQKPHSIKDTIEINAMFPHKLAEIPVKIIQIATDCTYSGKDGGYIETDKHDALDVYGKTKSLGEVHKSNFFNIRCSIIGLNEIKSLQGWFLSQPEGATVNGYLNHFWNGVTTLHFAKMCLGVIKSNIELPNVQHFVPKDTVSKEKLLKYIAEAFDRKDININKFLTPTIDRTLSTINAKINKELWGLAGYNKLPTIEKMVGELSKEKI